MTIDHVALFGGSPFANPGFTPQRLLAASSVVRGREAENAGVTAERLELFDPITITRIRQHTLTQDIPAADPTAEQQEQITAALNLLRTNLPHFTPLLGIPIRHRILQDSRAISASSFAWPQHVFLSPEAFTSLEQLAEQLTHEMCHCWLYLMEEVAPVQTASERVFRLPSGTSQRDTAEVLGALHVAVTLQILWAAIDVPISLRRTRSDDLRSYAEGCIALLKGEALRLLTAGGKSLTDDLAALHHQLTAKVATA